MTYEEVLELYKDTPLFFSNYYKYIFTYEGTHEPTGHKVVASCGGNSDDIYRHEVSRDSSEFFTSLWPSSISIYNKGGCIFSWSDW